MSEEAGLESQGRLDPRQRKAVLDAALEVFSETGLRGLQLDFVAARSGIEMDRVLAEFGRVEKLIETVLERELQLIAGSVTVPELRFPGETLRDELAVLARTILEEYRSNLRFLSRVLGEAMIHPELGVLFYRCFILRGRELFSEFLRDRKDRGELRSDLDVEAAAAFFLSALTFSLLLLEVFGGKSVETVPDDRLIGMMSDLFLNGVLEAKGGVPGGVD